MRSDLPTFADIRDAAQRIAPYAVQTPLLEHNALNTRTGGRILIKPEVLQRTGSFKFRGALNRLLLIPEGERRHGVVAFSSGNHAQGVAAAAGILGVPSVIVMPSDAPRAKVNGTRELGAEVVFYDRFTDDREKIALGICSERAATLVRPFDDPWVVAGQGTIGLELAQSAAARGIVLDAVLAPAGGGGMVSGVALALSAESPTTEIFSVEPENFDGMRRSLTEGRPTRAPGGAVSVADSLMALVPGDIPFSVARERLASGLVVSDSALLRAVSYAAKQLKLIVEPGGAAGLAALLSGAFDARGKTVAVVLSGGNCDFETVARACAEIVDP
jgi:threonine dehydratase